jgi:hypothetical protein
MVRKGSTWGLGLLEGGVELGVAGLHWRVVGVHAVVVVGVSVVHQTAIITITYVLYRFY